jgi:hypothetical protein
VERGSGSAAATAGRAAGGPPDWGAPNGRPGSRQLASAAPAAAEARPPACRARSPPARARRAPLGPAPPEKPPSLKRAVKGPRDGYTLTNVKMETMTAIPYDILKEGIA